MNQTADLTFQQLHQALIILLINSGILFTAC